MSSNSTSTLTELTGAVAQPAVAAIVEQPEPGWKFWLQTAILALGAYGTLTFIGWLKKPDESEAGAKPSVGKKKPATPGKATATPSRASAQQNASMAAMSAATAGGGKPHEGMMRIMQQVQEFSEIGRHEEAEKLVLTMMELVEREFQSNPSAFIDMLRLQRQLAEVYRKWGKHLQGIEILEQIAEQLTQLGAPRSELAGVFGDISSYYLEAGDFDKSEEYGIETIKMIEKAEGPASPNLFGICYSMALTMKKKKKFAEARTYCSRAITSLKKSDTPANQLQLLIVQMNMEIAEILLDEQKYDEAEELYKAVVESMLNSAFRERSYFAIQEIARNYFRIRKYDKAEEYLKKALDSLPDMPTEAKHELQSDLSILYTEIGKHEEAEQLITELKLRAIEAPLAQSRYFKTTEAMIKDDRYHLTLAVKDLPEGHLPPDAVIEVSFDEIPNKAEAFTFRHALDEAALKKKSILISSHPESAAGLAQDHRVATLKIYPSAVATEPIGIHKQIYKPSGLSSVVFPWLNLTKPEEVRNCYCSMFHILIIRLNRRCRSFQNQQSQFKKLMIQKKPLQRPKQRLKTRSKKRQKRNLKKRRRRSLRKRQRRSPRKRQK
eukprot:TRINITY_DN2124_c0_g2_i2.p1 TRINITY_DN2124_c0_g2~~TRINITY_DN2124_c0_g2_i2.p1  ORF type:complete len:608 (-),score=161.15 TRINITY_DN2124_c0_g2_i2:419-2242(-)